MEKKYYIVYGYLVGNEKPIQNNYKPEFFGELCSNKCSNECYITVTIRGLFSTREKAEQAYNTWYWQDKYNLMYDDDVIQEIVTDFKNSDNEAIITCSTDSKGINIYTNIYTIDQTWALTYGKKFKIDQIYNAINCYDFAIEVPNP